MIRTKGEAGTGDIVNAVRHMRAVFGHTRRLGALAEDELFREAKELRRALELGRGRRARAPPGRDLHGGRHRHAGRCGALHAARRGRRLRRLGHLQVADPAAAAKAIVEATTALQRPGDPRAGLDRPRRGHARPPGRARARRAARDARLVGRRACASVSWPSRATSASTSRCCGASASTGRGSQARAARGARRLDHPRRRVDGDQPPDPALRAGGGDSSASTGPSSGPARDDLSSTGRTSTWWTSRSSATPTGARWRASRPTSTWSGRRPLRGVFIRAPRSWRPGPASRCSAELDGEPVLLREGRFLVASFHPELTGDTRVHESSSSWSGRERNVRA